MLRVQSKADDPEESRRSMGVKADDLLSQSSRSFEPKQTILCRVQVELKQTTLGRSRRSLSEYICELKLTIHYCINMWIIADDLEPKQTILMN